MLSPSFSNIINNLFQEINNFINIETTNHDYHLKNRVKIIHNHSSSFYFDCHPPDELKKAFDNNDISNLESLSNDRKVELKKWIHEKFDICGALRRVWERRRFTEDLPSDRTCQNEYFLQGGQNVAASKVGVLSTLMNSKKGAGLLKPPFQGVLFVYEKDAKKWFKCCHQVIFNIL